MQPSKPRHVATRPALATGLILLVPLVMTIVDRHKPAGDGFHWSPGDFVVMGILVFSAGLTYALLARRLHSPLGRAVLGMVIFGALAAIWVELAVGAVSQALAYLAG